MNSEWRRKTTVMPGGRVEVSLPELPDGETVDVVVRRETKADPNRKRPGFGVARQKIRMSDDFDAPLTDFGDYQ